MSLKLKNTIAATDTTFSFADGYWTGKCLICGGWLRFHAASGFGANIEHILPRSLGGTNDLLNLGLTHPQCNGEKGRRWDIKRRHRQKVDRYRAIIDRLLKERQRRWREPADGQPGV
jgi:5-methylcytosine-specific restriction endonuclease McrA